MLDDLVASPILPSILHPARRWASASGRNGIDGITDKNVASVDSGRVDEVATPATSTQAQVEELSATDAIRVSPDLNRAVRLDDFTPSAQSQYEPVSHTHRLHRTPGLAEPGSRKGFLR
jgi:hypothetical protein